MMKMNMLKTAAIAFVAAGTAGFGAAQAENWNEAIELCAAAAEAEGIVDLSTYEPAFDKGSARRISLAMSSFSEGDVVKVECRISRGEVTSVVEK